MDLGELSNCLISACPLDMTPSWQKQVDLAHFHLTPNRLDLPQSVLGIDLDPLIL